MADSDTYRDVSAAALTVSIGGKTIVDFLDEGNPVECSDTEVTNIEWSCNGRMIRTVKPAAVMISVTVIPGSDSDQHLWQLWRDSFSNGGDCGEGINTPLTGSLNYPPNGSISLSNGTCISGPSGFSATGAGKMAGNTYTFAFEIVNR